MICFFVSDLMFKSRIKETIAGQDVIFPKSIEELSGSSSKIKKIFIDLNYKKSDPIELISSITTLYPTLEIIAFGSHMDTEKLAAAQDAGASEVIANSGFVKWLEGQRGASFLTLLVFGSILWAVTWYLFHYIPVQYRYYELQNAMHSISIISKDLEDKELRNRLLDQMRGIGTPGDIQSVLIERDGNTIHIRYEYGEKIIFKFFDKRYLIQSFHFILDITEQPQV
jgi:hypothetical protein